MILYTRNFSDMFQAWPRRPNSYRRGAVAAGIQVNSSQCKRNEKHASKAVCRAVFAPDVMSLVLLFLRYYR